MAVTRPVVLVFQEFASLSITAVAPELNALIAGPAYWIRDYPDHRTDGAVYGAKDEDPGTPVLTAGQNAITLADAPDNLAGALVEQASIRVFFENPRVLIAESAVATAAVPTESSIVIVAVNATPSPFIDVLPGDYATVKQASVTVALRVRSVVAVEGDTDTTHTLNFYDEHGLTLDATTINASWRIERQVADQSVTAEVAVAESGQVTIKGGVKIDARDVTYAEAHLAYRALRQDLAELGTISGVSEILGRVGPIDARNPLAVGLFVALQNTGTVIQYYGVKTDDLAGYMEMVESVEGRKDVYAVVPLSTDIAVIKMLNDSFATLADPSTALRDGVPQKFRVVIGAAADLPTSRIVVDTSTGTVTGSELYDSAGTFIDSGVNISDLVVIGSTSYAVASILSNQRLTVTGTPPAGAATYSIRRTLDRAGQVAHLASIPGSLASQRAILCWPDKVDVAGLTDGSLARHTDAPLTHSPAGTQSGKYLACAVGAMTAALPSHQGLSNLGIGGISKLYNSNTHFRDRELAALSRGGWMVFQQDTPEALPYIAHQLTTDPSALEFGEYSMVKNRDYVSLFLADILSDFPGKWNINKETLGFLQVAIEGGIETLRLDRRVRIGAPINNGRITSLAQSTISKDRIELYVEIDFPAPLNTVALHIVSI
jgi:hypothetical protein